MKLTLNGTPLQESPILSKIAANLRQFGYPDVTPEVVRSALSKPKTERDIIGMMAARQLEENGIEITLDIPPDTD